MDTVRQHDLEVLDEAFARLHATGPEFDGWLSNHGPMAVESLVQHGCADYVDTWVDRYTDRLEEFPRPYERITGQDWPDALGDPRRLGDWPVWFGEQLRQRPWPDVLAQWWPRLLTGVAASATHGVIRVGHAVRTLREAGENPIRLTELAQALGYWAARWQPIAGGTAPVGALTPSAALAQVPLVADQSGGVNHRLGQLADTEGWQAAQAAAAAPREIDDVPRFVREVVAATVDRYRSHGHRDPVMLVHGSTGPNAILRVLPSVPHGQWLDSARAAWTVAAGLHAAYAPAEPAVPATVDGPPADEMLERILASGDAHAIKFADTALDVYRWTGASTAIAAAAHAAELIVG